MPGLNLFRARIKTTLTYYPVSPYEPREQLEKRISSLESDEKKVFEWMLLYFSDNWIAETLMIGKRHLREIKRTIFFKLGVKNQTSMYRVYEFAAASANTIPDVREIDEYVEQRTEKEIKEIIKNGG